MRSSRACERLLERGVLRFEARDARQAEAPAPRGRIVTNPPYGEQSNPKSASVPALMREVGDRLKHAFAGWDAWLLTTDRGLPGQMRLQESRKTVLYNGPLECRFFRFSMVEGSYRRRSQPDESRCELPLNEGGGPLGKRPLKQ